jgi:NADH:ubiquinone oxidoreductase subunit 4 (subunit M)
MVKGLLLLVTLCPRGLLILQPVADMQMHGYSGLTQPMENLTGRKHMVSKALIGLPALPLYQAESLLLLGLRTRSVRMATLISGCLSLMKTEN